MPTTAAIIKSQVVDFNSQMAKIISDLNKYINYGKNFTIEAGWIMPIEANFESAIMISNGLMDALADSGYYDLIKKFSTNNKDFSTQQIKEMAKRFKGAETYYGAIEKTTLTSLQTMQYNGMAQLGQEYVGKIGQVLYSSVITGTTDKQLLMGLETQLGNLSRYSETYLRTAKREYSQQTEFEIAKAAGIDRGETIWEYIGAPLQANSHPECEYALIDKPHAPFFTTAEMEEFQAGGGYDHTEPRWNCQHIFGITDMTLAEYETA